MEIITGYFISKGQALISAEYLRNHGFQGRISVLGRSNEEDDSVNGDNNLDFTYNIAAGGLMGGAIGITTGMVQGVGQIFAPVPIEGNLYRNEGVSIDGMLNQWGVPEKVGEEIKGVIKEGNTAMLIECKEVEKWNVRDMLEKTGAQNIHI